MPLLVKSGNCSPNESMLEWSQTSSCFYATSRAHKGLISELQNHNWKVVSVGKHMLELKWQVLFSCCLSIFYKDFAQDMYAVMHCIILNDLP